jgi:hypothetical protein
MSKFGFTDAEWQAGKNEIRDVLVERAKIRGMIAYSELVGHLTSVSVEPHDPRLFHLLGDVSRDEDAAGRGMLTAIVVHKTGDMEPGPGFFELAQQLGRDTSDLTKCWIEEVKTVHAHYA